MKFNYQARTKKGNIQVGTVQAPSREAALKVLQRYGLYVTLLEKAAIFPFYAKKIKIFEKVPQKDIVLFSRQLAIMFKSEVPMVEALNTLAKQVKNSSFKEKILTISEEVEGGSSFSLALSHFPKIFSSFYTSVIKSGEASGKLSQVLDYLADHLEREYHLRSKITGAMIYPALIVFVVFLVLLLMVFFVVPRLAQVLEGTGQELPMMTQVVISGSAIFKKWIGLFAAGFVVFMAAAFRYYKSSDGKKFFDRLSLRLPVLGELLAMIYISRFAENFSTLISGGIPIAQSLEITADIVGNETYKEIVLKAREEVQKGETISSVLLQYPDVIPPVFTQMTIVAEKTGTLDKSLMLTVDFYQKEVERAIESFLSILEPLLIVSLGTIVAGIMFAVLMPLYQTISL